MSAVGVTFGRTVGNVRRQLSTALVFACFLAVSAVFFVFGVEAAECSRLPLALVWAQGVSPVLPALAAFLAMGVWSDERASGRMDLLLSVAVRERDYVLGKFAGVWLLTGLATALHLAGTLVVLLFVAPRLLAGAGVASFLMALLALLLQGLLWSAVSVALSAMCRRAVTAACLSVVVLVVLPRMLWIGLRSWSEEGRTAFGEMPFDAHVADLASGLVPLGTVAGYLVAAGVCLFVATKCVVACRFVGQGAVGLRISTVVASLLSLVFLGLSLAFFLRFDPVVEVSGSGVSPAVSMRTRDILAESPGRISVTCFLSRRESRFRETCRLLRLLKREADAVGGARIELRFVDPNWDIGAAGRLVRRGVAENCVVFERGRRMVALPVDREFDERLCASAIRRISSPVQRKRVYWTVGHGEYAPDAYGAFGMSDIARDLAREGFSNASIDLLNGQPIPADCALVLIAGAKDDFSRAEIGRLDDYLKEGGRLLVLLQSAKSGGVVSMLPAWGVRPLDQPVRADTTISGTDVAVSGFSDHAISAPLKGSRIVLERPVAFAPSAVAGTGAGADSVSYSPVAQVDSVAVAAAVERGAGAGRDIALRPTRIVAIGDATFVLNGQLGARASANRDFFLNCIAYLSGSDTYASDSADAGTSRAGLDRRERLHLVAWTALAGPAAVFLLLLIGVRRRSVS